MNERRTIPLTRARVGYDKRGKDSRQPVLASAIQGGVLLPLSAENARSVVRNTSGALTANWQAFQPCVYQTGGADPAIVQGLDLRNPIPLTLANNWTATWHRHDDESGPVLDTVSISTRPKIPISTNQWGGHQWNKTLWLDVTAAFPIHADIDLEASAVIELLDNSDATIFQATLASTTDIGGDVQSQSHVVYVGAGNVDFYGIRATVTYDHTPSVDMPDDVIVLGWMEAQVIE